MKRFQFEIYWGECRNVKKKHFSSGISYHPSWFLRKTPSSQDDLKSDFWDFLGLGTDFWGQICVSIRHWDEAVPVWNLLGWVQKREEKTFFFRNLMPSQLILKKNPFIPGRLEIRFLRFLRPRNRFLRSNLCLNSALGWSGSTLKFTGVSAETWRKNIFLQESHAIPADFWEKPLHPRTTWNPIFEIF